jgi:translation initiation factor RLI1
MEAIAVNDGKVAEVNEGICIGCGVCKPTCSAEAVALVQRQEVTSPPELTEFLTARYKGA